MNESRPVLLAEDDPNEVFLMQRAFIEAGIAHPLLAVRDGGEAISYLSGAGVYADRRAHPLPCLLLLDLAMPGLDGFGVLAWLRQQFPLRDRVPALVLTDSYNTDDLEKATELGAKEYITKPFEHRLRVQLLRELNQRWLSEAPAPDSTPKPLRTSLDDLLPPLDGACN